MRACSERGVKPGERDPGLDRGMKGSTRFPRPRHRQSMRLGARRALAVIEKGIFVWILPRPAIVRSTVCLSLR